MDEEKKNVIQLMLGFVRICSAGGILSDHVIYPVYPFSHNTDPLHTIKL